ncbi:MAG TPA: winged helix-turn-helix domain-containing protein [Acetobacteraceae bacterium]|nr:winged helix-turn-helix domain-containing protein [Acetobacteraceae bacterium]
MDTTPAPSPSLAFGRFRVLPHRRELLADDRPVELGGRAFDVLLALIEAQGAVVSRDAVMARAWPGRMVETNALEVQISALRAALGPERELIRTVSGRGYRFAAEIRLLPASKSERADRGEAAPEPRGALPPTNLPEAVSDLVGRQNEVQEILTLAASHRLVTLVGPGGIGKTRLALAAANRLLAQFADGVWLAEFSPLSDPGLVPATVAAAVGLGLAAGEVSARRVAQALGGRRSLLVLDTCEHVIDAAAELAEAVLRAGSGTSIIATSREPLRAEWEQIYAVPPLAVPAGEGEDLWDYDAVRLFAARWREAGAQIPDDRRVASAIAAICRQLDGMPLAIELAAARASTLGIRELAARLDDRFNLLTGGWRAALPRHKTLRATLNWSHELLPVPERVILHRLAIFAGTFSLDAATAVAAGAGIARADVIDGFANLVAKSLVVMAADGTVARFRLLDTTRAYALEKLVESGEVNAIRRRHAEHYRDVLQAATENKAGVDDWPAAHAVEIDNIRAALAWAFSPQGDASIGVALAADSVPIWFEMSWLTECRGWMEKALGVLDGVDQSPNREMVLQYALGYALIAQGMNDRARTTLTRAGELAESLADLDYQLRTLAGLASICHRLQDFERAVALGRRAEEAVKGSSDPSVLATADWILGTSLQSLPEYAEALTYARRTYDRAEMPAVRRAHITRLGRDSLISAGASVAMILCAQGLLDQSAQAARNVLADAEAGHHAVSMCLALTWCGCVIPLRLGELETAQRSIARLKDHAQSLGLSAYHANGLCFEGLLLARRGDVAAAVPLLRAGLKSLQQTESETFYTVFLTGLAEILMVSSHRDKGLAAADEALRRTEHSKAFSWMPEALRIKGEVLLSCQNDVNAAEDHFRRSLDLAHRQGALSWELRTATSFARLRRAGGRIGEARDLLVSVYGRFTEGFGTADLRSAKALIEELEAEGPGAR